jgi:hypothetical protein
MAAAEVHPNHIVVDDVGRQQRTDCGVGTSAVRHGPYDGVGRLEVFRHPDPEHEHVPDRVEILGLPGVRTERRNVVVAADRDVHLLVAVPVEISEDEIPRSTS